MAQIDELFADFPDAARTLLKRYYGYWRIAPIEELLSQPGLHHIGAIPRDLRRIIALHVQTRITIYDSPKKDQPGLIYTVCGLLHRLDSGPAIESKYLTCYCKYGVSHCSGGASTVRIDNNHTYRFWAMYGEPHRRHNMPTNTAKQIDADGTVQYSFAEWCGEHKKAEYISSGVHAKLFMGNRSKFIATTDLASGVCHFAVEHNT